ncbi:phage major capsid protein [Granulibacter bethesdensis]|uniref:phage major capsid protein n=1 Tax=Granulibacter bethesdensis TaxID=364410 RepID=UPI00046D5BE7|nr:phage major capsid protein [Granulibacter bethesdensis]
MANHHLETRSAGESPSISDVMNAVGSLQKTFSEFRESNDLRIVQIEKRGSPDVVTDEKVTRLNDELTRLSTVVRDMETRGSRPAAAGAGNQERAEVIEHRTAWNTWMRRGRGEDELRDLERRANTTAVPEDGGLLVPHIVDARMLELLRAQSAVRSLFDVLQVSSEDYSQRVNFGGAGSGWVGETDSRPHTTGAKWGTISGAFGEIYCNIQVSQKLLDDSIIDLEAFYASETAYQIGQQEGAAFLLGDGSKKPKGLLSSSMSAANDAARAFGTIQFLATGVAADLPSTAPADKLIDMIYALKKGYRQNAGWLMNGKTVSTVRKWKDAQGNYLWQPGLQAGEPGQILGYGVTDIEEMPDIGANAFPIGFGDFKRAYRILDRIGIRTLRDPFTEKPFVNFYSTKRVGGMLLDSNAVKLMKCST